MRRLKTTQVDSLNKPQKMSTAEAKRKSSRLKTLEDFINLSQMAESEAFKKQPRLAHSSPTTIPEVVTEGDSVHEVTQNTNATSIVPSAKIQTNNMASSTPKHQAYNTNTWNNQ